MECLTAEWAYAGLQTFRLAQRFGLLSLFGSLDSEDIGTGTASAFPGEELTEGVCCSSTLSVELPVGMLSCR